ncbi:MAG: ADP-dependent NAD(P)H-hydrate dehydratase / NAD(P)H-hydrate epimerase, partial [Pseudonocardiales bacterium]|nr:ADP-dependent NAD(P)H-hydrate dehydratase / NAD(P)H-hydrate epimerase [Pseudonocardiales bacterium]
MQGVWPVEEIRAAERQLLAGLADGALMARAARAVTVETVGMLGFSYGARVVLLVGPGDNGGDALYAGAELSRRGVAVAAVLADPAKAHAGGLAALRAAGGRQVPLADAGPADLIIDGLLGIGARGPVREALIPLVRWSLQSPAPVLSVDIPSGVDPDTGAVAGPAVRAAATVCMGALKAGLLVGQGRLHTGRLRLVELGLGPRLPEPRLLRLERADFGRPDFGRALPLPAPGPQDDKYTRGVVGVAAGSQAYPGAAQLCVGSARLGGVGAVRYAGHAAAEVVRRWPEVIVSDTVAEAGRVQAWVLGPGLGDTAGAVQSLEQVLASDAAAVVDADGLNLLAGRRELLDGRSGATVLTPHDREFERLFGEVGLDRVAAARRAARDTGAVAGPAVQAAVTVCMGALKTGLLVGQGRLHTGRLRLIDLGLGPRLPEPRLHRLEREDLALPTPGPRDDKYTRGVVGVAAGSQA